MFIPDYDSSTDPNNPDNHAVHPFCTDMNCMDKDDPEAIAELEAYRQQGLISDEDASNIYRGRTI